MSRKQEGSRPGRWWIALIRLLIVVLVLAGLSRAIIRGVAEIAARRESALAEIARIDARIALLESQPGRAEAVDELASWRRERSRLLRSLPDWRRLHAGWLAGAAAAYLAGLLPMACYWRMVLRAFGQDPSWSAAVRSYYLSHLGKYVPGKALVVVLRSALVVGDRVAYPPAVAAVFVETLTLMACGAAISAVILALASGKWWMSLLGAALAVAAGAPTWPPLFRRLAGRAAARGGGDSADWLQGLSLSLILRGWRLAALSWLGLGVSLAAVLLALPGGPTLGEAAAVLPLCVAAAALAMVAGFLSLLPGGAGVRELVLTEVFAAAGYGAGLSLLAAVLLRLVWLLSELAASAILYPSGRRSPPPLQEPSH